MGLKLILLALSLAAGGPVSLSDMPDLKDNAAVRAAVLTLDPIPPGGNPNDAGADHLGQVGSDRYYFTRWVERYQTEDYARQDNVDYAPAPVPTSIAAAIAEQRQFEAKQKVAQAEGARRAVADHQASERRLTDSIQRQDEQRAASSRASEKERERLAQLAGDRRAGYDVCAADRFKAQAAGRLEDQAAIYQAHDCDRLLQPAK